MSQFTVRITTAIHQDGIGGFTPATVVATLTQVTGVKIKIPKRGQREAEFTVNLNSAELAAIYSSPGGFTTHSKFLHVKWRGFNVFWGPILDKSVDFEAETITLRCRDQGARLEAHYFRIGDTAMNHPTDSSKGYVPVDSDGLGLALEAGEVPAASEYIPLGIRLGTINFTDQPTVEVLIERGQEVWRTMTELTERTDGPLFEIEPLDETDVSGDFAKLNVFGQVRNDVSATIQFEYNTGFNNLRNVKWNKGGKLLSHVHTLTQDNEWRVTAASVATGEEAGVWIQWEQVDFNVRGAAEALAGLGAIGEALLDAYGRTLNAIELVLRRDDEIGATSQFYYMTDFKVSDLVHVEAVKASEVIAGNYQVEEVRLEQASDGTGEVQQFVDVVPFVAGDFTYIYNTDQTDDD